MIELLLSFLKQQKLCFVVCYLKSYCKENENSGDLEGFMIFLCVNKKLDFVETGHRPVSLVLCLSPPRLCYVFAMCFAFHIETGQCPVSTSALFFDKRSFLQTQFLPNKRRPTKQINQKNFRLSLFVKSYHLGQKFQYFARSNLFRF